MSEDTSLSARFITHSSRALAGYAAGDLLQTQPDLAAGLGPAPLERWRQVFVQCLEELAAALLANRPGLFVDYVVWMRSLLTSRGMPDGGLEAALESLCRVLAAELPAEAVEAATGACRDALEAVKSAGEPSGSRLATDSDEGRLAGNYLLALLEGDRNRATRLVLDAAEAGHDVADLYLKVLLPAQQEAGRMWQDAEINVAEEHFTTNTTRSVMAQLARYAPRKEPTGKTILVVAVAGNQHDLGVQAVAEFFEMAGWRAIQLGADLPIPDLVQAVDFYRADLLGLSVALRSQMATLKQTIEAVRHSERGRVVKILVGGRALLGNADLAATFGADGYALDPIEAVALGNALVGLDRDGTPLPGTDE
ncbi:MAG: cobalamin-dependent protein [Thermoguttaceae bacterium]|nr:cobalamin-dependent protein [Thermoguttaceae bacterium]